MLKNLFSGLLATAFIFTGTLTASAAPLFQGEFYATTFPDTFPWPTIAEAEAIIAAGPATATFQTSTLSHTGGATLADVIGAAAATTLSAPVGGNPAGGNPYVLRYTGFLDLAAGADTFNVRADDGFKLTVGGVEVSRCETFITSGCFGSTITNTLNLGTGATAFELIYTQGFGGSFLMTNLNGGAPIAAAAPSTVPLPAGGALLGAGLAFFGFGSWRKKRANPT